MGALTKREREGLEDIFLSIHSNNHKYKKLKEISSLIISYNPAKNLLKLFKQARYGLKETKIGKVMFNIRKKKKNLSK